MTERPLTNATAVAPDEADASGTGRSRRPHGIRRYVSDGTVPGRPAFRIGVYSTVWRPRQFFTTLSLIGVSVVLFCVSIGVGD